MVSIFKIARNSCNYYDEKLEGKNISDFVDSVKGGCWRYFLLLMIDRGELV